MERKNSYAQSDLKSQAEASIDQILDYQPANLSIAKKHRINQQIRQDDGTYYPICQTDLEQLGKYGIGLQLYFRMLRSLTILSCFMTLIAGISLYSNFVGDYFNDVQGASVIQMGVVANQNSFDATSGDVAAQQIHMEQKQIY